MDLYYGHKLASRYGIKLEVDSKVPGLDDISGVEAVSVFNWGIVVVYPENIKSQARFEEVMRHEILGHYAIRKCLASGELKTICERVAAAQQGTQLHDDIQRAYGDDAAIIGEEIMANLAELEYKPDFFPLLHPTYSLSWIQDFLLQCHVVSDLRTYHDESNIEFACCRVLR